MRGIFIIVSLWFTGYYSMLVFNPDVLRQLFSGLWFLVFLISYCLYLSKAHRQPRTFFLFLFPFICSNADKLSGLPGPANVHILRKCRFVVFESLKKIKCLLNNWKTGSDDALWSCTQSLFYVHPDSALTISPCHPGQSTHTHSLNICPHSGQPSFQSVISFPSSCVCWDRLSLRACAAFADLLHAGCDETAAAETASPLTLHSL